MSVYKVPLPFLVSSLFFTRIKQVRIENYVFKFLARSTGLTLSVTNVYSIIGDLNIRRNMTAMNIASRQALATCQVIDCPQLNNLEGALASVRDTSTVCVFSAISELLASGPDRGTVQASVKHVLTSVASKLAILCRARPSLQVEFLDFISKG